MVLFSSVLWFDTDWYILVRLISWCMFGTFWFGFVPVGTVNFLVQFGIFETGWYSLFFGAFWYITYWNKLVLNQELTY